MLSAGLDGILCQVVLYTSALFLARNQISVEFTTPANVAPQSMLLCFNSTSMVMDDSSFRIVNLQEGGDMFNMTGHDALADNTDWTRTSFFRSSSTSDSPCLDPASFGTLRDVMSRDVYYASSFVHQRLDDMYQDWQGLSLAGTAQFSLPGVSKADYTAQGNCALLTGAWQQGTRYELTFEVTNQAAQTSDLTEPMPALWLAAATAQSVSMHLANGQQVYDLQFAIRGDKHGTICKIRQPAAEVLGMLWDPCRVLANITAAAPAGNMDSDACLSQLASLHPADPDAFPFNQPPLRAYNSSSFWQSQSQCSTSQVWSPRYGGTCIDCAPGTPPAGGEGPCQCPYGNTPAAVGPAACGLLRRSNSSLADSRNLANTLCASYTSMQTRWQNMQLSAKIVSRLVLKAFRKEAETLLDEADMRAANDTFYTTYVTDKRRPESPSRTTGVKPQCNKCHGSYFHDVVRGREGVPVFDHQFDAMNTFRFIGFLLDAVVGVPCPTLWDRQDPMQWKYGFYQDIMCQALPEVVPAT